MDAIEKKTKAIFAQQFQLSVEEVKLELRFVEDLNADSYDYVELQMAFLEEFGKELPAEPEKFKSIGDVVVFFQETQ